MTTRLPFQSGPEAPAAWRVQLGVALLMHFCLSGTAMAATMSGTVAYSGGQTGVVVVSVSSSSNGTPVVASNLLNAPGPFLLTNLNLGESYWLSAYRDSNGNGSNDVPEARTAFTNNPIVLTNDLSGVALNLVDPDSDGDGMPDWWELKYGLDPLDHAMDGELVVPAGQTYYVDAVKSPVVGSNPAGSFRLNVLSTNGFKPKDYVLIICIQDPNQTQAGTYEIGRVSGLGSDYLSLNSALTNSYVVSNGEKVQVVKVPYFSSAQIDGTVTCSPWNEETGGIVAFHCNGTVSLNTNSTITADGKGFRGGLAGPNGGNAGSPGESTSSRETSPAGNVSENSQGGGGASTLSANCGGGGGHGSSGESGAYYILSGGIGGQGASSFGMDDLRRVYFGGGGGGSASGGANRWGIDGGNGGGIIIVTSRRIVGAGTISSRGANGNAYFTNQDGLPNGSGGGAGGSIAITALTTNTFQILANGGNGGRRPVNEFPNSPLYTTGGGNGGGGRIRIDPLAGSLLPSASPGPGYVAQSVPTNAVFDLILDTDIDGLNDLQEFQAGTNPLLSDTDGDGMPDQWELRYGLMPANPADASPDSDGDGFTNFQEFQNGTNPGVPDSDQDGIRDGWEVQFGFNPLDSSDAAVDSDLDGLTNLQEFQNGTDPNKADTDNDGIPDGWEVQYSLNPLDSADAVLDYDADGLSNVQEFTRGTNPRNTDTDNDSLSDFDELFIYGTNPFSPDTDGDGLPDGWEVQNALNPRHNDANEDKDFDGVTNLEEYQWNLAHTNVWEQMSPARAFSGTNAVSDYERLHGIHTRRPVYDKNARLIGEEYSSGYSLAYVYDGNGNRTREKLLSRASETNGLPALFSFLNGLTNDTPAAGPYGDADGDGWSNWQEWRSGSHPNDPASVPRSFGDAGKTIGAVTNLTGATNYLAATGNLDGLPGDEIVVGAAGDFSNGTNELKVFAFSGVAWVPETLELGNWSVTSLTVGQVTNRVGPSIYLGLAALGSSPRLVEYARTNGVWTSNLVMTAQGNDLRLLGITDDGSLIVNLTTNGVTNGVYRMSATNATQWALTLLSTNSSGRGPMASSMVPGFTPRGAAIRRLDSGSLEIASGIREIYKDAKLLPTEIIPSADGNKLYFTSTSTYTWGGAEGYAVEHGGHLVTVNNQSENQFILDTVAVDLPGTTYWIGLHFVNNIPGQPSNFFDWRWVDGSSAGYRNWTPPGPPSPIDPISFPIAVQVNRGAGVYQGTSYPHGTWGGPEKAARTFGVFQVLSPWQVYSNYWLIAPQSESSRILEGTEQLMAVSLFTNANGQASTFFHSWLEDNNLDSGLGKGDSVVVEQIILASNSWSRGIRLESVMGNTPLSPHRGLALLNNPESVDPLIAVAGPDNTIRLWRTNDTGHVSGVLYVGDTGKRWQGLHAVRNPAGGEALLGLEYSISNAALSLRLWQPDPFFTTIDQAVPQTAPSAVLLGDIASGGSQSLVRVRLWDNEGNSSSPSLEFQYPGAAAWSNATILSIDGQVPAPASALPSGSNHDLIWEAGRDLGAGFTNTVMLRVRAHDFALTGDYSAPTPYLVTISAGNPMAFPDNATTPEDTPVDIPVLVNDTVQGGQTLTIVSFSQPANGLVLSKGNQTLRYTSQTNFFGTDSFSYTITDGVGGTNTAQVTVTVTGVNDPPLSANYSFATVEDSSLAFPWTNTLDAEGDLVTLFGVIPTSTAGGTVTSSGGSITYTPATNFNGTDTFKFVVRDDGSSNGQPDPRYATNTVTVTVLPVNDSPVILLATNQFMVAEDSLAVVPGVTVMDPDAGEAILLVSLTVTNGSLYLGTNFGGTLQSGSTNGSSNLVFQSSLQNLNAALTNLAYRPATNYFGPDTLTVSVNDQGNTGSGGPLAALKTIPITVNAVNDPPSVVLVKPTNGAVFLTADSVLLEAQVTAGDSPVAKVEFYQGATKLGETNGSPYRYTWVNPPANPAATLTAKAYDTLNSNQVSVAVTVEVRQPGLILLPNVLPQSVAELSPFVLTNKATDPDIPSTPIRYLLLAAPAGATIDTNGVIRWTPGEAEGPGTYTFDTEASDPGIAGRQATNRFLVTVAEVNLPPLPKAIPNQAVNELALLTVDASTTDPDLPANTLAYSLLNNPAGMTINAGTGLIGWTPSEAQGPSTNVVVVKATDGGGLSVTNSFVVTVNEVNSAPVLAAIGNQTVAELTTLTVSLSATDADVPANTLTFEKLAGPPGLSVNGSSGLLTWTPGEAEGPATNTVVVRVMDNGSPSLSSTQTFTVVVNEVNVAPVLAAVATKTIQELNPLSFNLAASDADLPVNQLTYALVSGPAGVGVNSAGVFSWTPTAAQGPSTNTIAVKVTDNGVPPLSHTNSFTVIVSENNSSPVLGPIGNQTINEGTTLSVTATATDNDIPANVLTYSLVTKPTGMTINGTSGLLTWTPGEADGPGTNTVTVRVTDNGVPPLSDERSFTAVIREVNAAPVLAVITNRTVNELTTLTFTNSATDGDLPADTLVYALGAGAPTGAVVNPTNGVFTWTATEAQGPGTNMVSVIVTDNGTPSLRATQTFTVTVTEVNSAPVLAAIGNQTVAELTTLTVSLSASDGDAPANTLTYEKVAGPSGLSVNGAGGLLTWTPTESQGSGTNIVTVRVTDNGTPSLSATQTFTVTVTEVNSAPVLAAAGNRTVDELTLLSLTLSATDADVPANTLTFGKLGGPPGLSVNGSSGLLTWTPGEAEGPSTNTVTVRVADNGAPSLSSTQTFSVVVNEVNTAPVLAAVATKTAKELNPLSFNLTASDADMPANQLTFALVSGPAGVAVNSTGVFSWTPTEAQGPSTNTITVKVTDNGLPPLSHTNSFTVIVSENNSSPVMGPIANQSVDEGLTLSVTASATDNDIPANVLTFSLVTKPTGMTINSNSGLMTWTPGEVDGPGTNTVTVRVTDNGVPPLSDERSFTAVIREVNAAPVLAVITNRTVNELTTLTFTNSATDGDLPADTLVYALGAGAPTGAVVNPTNGVFTWTPTEAQGPDTNVVTIIVTDNGSPGMSATQGFTVVVGEVNTVPELVAVLNRTNRAYQLFSITNSATDSDLPANQLTFEIVAAPSGVSLNPTTGVITWTPSPNQLGSNSISLRVVDNGSPSLSATQSFLVYVNAELAPRVVITYLNGIVILTWNAEAGQTYRVQFKTNLNQSNWQSLTGDISATTHSAEKVDFNGGGAPMRFYRVLIP